MLIHTATIRNKYTVNTPGGDVLLMLQNQLEQDGCTVGPSKGRKLGEGNQGSGVAHQLNNQSMDELHINQWMS
jgi:hypothetical protein